MNESKYRSKSRVTAIHGSDLRPVNLLAILPNRAAFESAPQPLKYRRKSGRSQGDYERALQQLYFV